MISCLQYVISISTGAPQGCVLSAILFIIYTNELRSRFRNCHLIKYADDTRETGEEQITVGWARRKDGG